MSEKTHKCITCNGVGEVAVQGTDMLVGCWDCDYDGKVTAEEYNAQMVYHLRMTMEEE